MNGVRFHNNRFTRRAAYGVVIALSLIVSASTLGAVILLGARPLRPAHSGMVTEAMWNPGRPGHFEVRMRLSPAYQRDLFAGTFCPACTGRWFELSRVETNGRTVPAQKLGVATWAWPHTGETTLTGKTLQPPLDNTVVHISVKERLVLPWWKRLSPARWSQTTEDVRFSVSSQPIRLARPDSAAAIQAH